MGRLAAATRLGPGWVLALLLLPAAAFAQSEPAAPAGFLAGLAERFAVERIAVGRLAVEIVASPLARPGPLRASSFVVPLARIVDAELTPEMVLGDVRISRVGHPGGWDGEASLREVRIADGPAPGERSIDMVGTLNATPLSVAARFGAVEAAVAGRRQRSFAIRASLRGIEETLDGVLDADGRALDAHLRLDVPALGDLLDALDLRRQLEGRGQLQLAVAGPVDRLRADDIRLTVKLETGEQLRADGRIADLLQLDGIDLGFTANLVDAAGGAPRLSAALKLDLEALRGRVEGSAEALTLDGLVLSTNLTIADIREIGPISVQRLSRDAQGRLALSGIRILAGDARAPSLDLAGRIDDLLGRSGMAFRGRFDLDLIGLASGRPAPAGLGRLAGELTLSDASGRLQLEHLEARQVGGGPLGIAVEKVAVAPGQPESPISVALDIPDLDALAAIMDEAPIGGGSADFAGSIDPRDGFAVFGRGRVGASPVWLDLVEDVIDDRLILRGGVKSPRLLLADLPRIVGLVGLWPKREEAPGRAGEQLRARLDAELDTEATIVDAAGTERGAFTSRLTVRDDVLTLRPLRLDYLGGRATAELTVALARNAPPVRLEAHVQALETGALLTELGLRPLLLGRLDAAIDLAAVGPDRDALAASLDGEVEVLVGPGQIGSRLLDLTAQDIVGWLFSAGGGTRLVCAAARLAFASGRGTLEGFVLETDNIRLLGAGEVDLGRETLDLGFTPRPVRGRLLPAVTSFRVHGPLAEPSFTLGSPGGVAGRAIVETLTLPFNVLGALLGGITGDRPGSACAVEP